jgi:hypothetical protein
MLTFIPPMNRTNIDQPNAETIFSRSTGIFERYSGTPSFSRRSFNVSARPREGLKEIFSDG